MKIIFLLIILLISQPTDVKADYFKRTQKKIDSAIFHGLLFCKVKYQNLAIRDMEKVSDAYIADKGINVRDIDKRHWNGAKFYADQIAPRCKMTKNKKIFYRVMDIVGD